MMSSELLVLHKEIIKPDKPTFMIAGFNQWANAGNVLKARKGAIAWDSLPA